MKAVDVTYFYFVIKFYNKKNTSVCPYNKNKILTRNLHSYLLNVEQSCLDRRSKAEIKK